MSTLSQPSLRMESPPKFKKGYNYQTWVSKFKTFIDRMNPALNKMYLKEGHEILPAKEVAHQMLTSESGI